MTEHEPLTDEYLTATEVSARDCRAYHTYCDSGEVVPSNAVPRLVAEVRRLRSDEWLTAAAKEIALEVDSLSTWHPQEDCWEDILPVLKKHRDGKA